jgi:hypothetical protein
LEVGDDGSAVVAWRARSTTVAVQERGPGGALRGTKVVSAAGAGPVSEPGVAGSGLGDGIVAYRQGGPDDGLVAAAITDAPPLEFEVQAPIPFVRSRRVGVSWDAARNALSAVRYAVTVDGVEIAGGLGARSMRVPAALVGDGRHELRVIAVDRFGQETQSLPATLRIDRRPPRIKVRRRGSRGVRVTVSDGSRGRVAGVAGSRTSVAFGDGRRRRGSRARHTYRRPGRYRVVVRTRDRAGNRAVVRRAVVAR